jgi:hypothetical protein
MKHLRKFNEEFYPDTYRETGEVLKKKGHYTKGGEFIKHAKLLEDNADRKLWEKYKAKYQKYGEVEIKYKKSDGPKTLKAYPVLSLDIAEFEDFYRYKEDVERGGYGEFTLIEGYVISNEEDYEWIRTSYEVLDYFGNTKSYKYIEGGYFQCRRIVFRIQDTDNGFEIIQPQISGIDIEDDPDTRNRFIGVDNRYPNRGFMISDYKNAGKLYKLILRCLTDSSFDYPSDIDGVGYDSVTTMYGVIQRMIITNWSSNFGINDSEDFADEFKKKYPSPFDIFKEL